MLDTPTSCSDKNVKTPLTKQLVVRQPPFPFAPPAAVAFPSRRYDPLHPRVDLRDGKLGNVCAYVLIPQCPANKSGWQSIATQVFALIDQISNQHPVDTSRVILTGHSMGGTGTWALGAMAPKRFSCIVPMSGSISLTASKQKALSKLTVWAIVGEKDKTVLPTSSRSAIEKLQKAQGEARLTILPGAAHRDVPAQAWLDPQLGLLDWMLSQ